MKCRMKAQIKKVANNTIPAATGFSNIGIKWNSLHYYSVSAHACHAVKTEGVKEADHTRKHMNRYEDEEGNDICYVRANLGLNIIGQDPSIKLEICIGLRKPDFEQFLTNIFRPEGHVSYFGIIGNDLPGYPPIYGKTAKISFCKPMHLPTVEFDSDHPLSKDMKEGISAEQAAKYIELMDSICH